MNANPELVKLAVDVYKGTPDKYSLEEAKKSLYKAIVDINGGTEFGYKQMRDAQYNGLFALIEEVIPQTVVSGLSEDDLFNTMIEMRNAAEGDSPVFEVEDVDFFEVSRVAHGSRGLRRQRLGGRKQITVNTELHGIRIYEPMRRLLANRVDFNHFINRVGESWRQNILNDCYTCWAGLTADKMGGEKFFPAAGSYNENAVLDVIEHVEAASGKQATIIGTGKAIRHLAPSIQGAQSKNDLYTLGYYGSFYGTPVVKMPQRHKIGTTDFLFPDDVLHIIASDAKPIKLVYEGNSIIKLTDAMDNADMTQEYEFYDAYGLGVVVADNEGIGRIELSD